MIRQNRKYRAVNVKGFTLVEVLVVVVIIGVLSSMGVAGLQGAVANARVKDAAFNTKAYLENISQESKRIKETLCVKKTSDIKLVAYKGECSSTSSAEVFNEFTLESPSKFVTTSCPSNISSNWATSGGSAEFKPRIGLNSAPSTGCFVIQYSGDNRYGAVIKSNAKNFFEALTSNDGTNWSGI